MTVALGACGFGGGEEVLSDADLDFGAYSLSAGWNTMKAPTIAIIARVNRAKR